jgi:transposase
MGRPIAQVARELGLHQGTLGRWVNLDRCARDGEAVEWERTRRAEPAAQGKENAELAIERDLLKRSAAPLGQGSDLAVWLAA